MGELPSQHQPSPFSLPRFQPFSPNLSQWMSLTVAVLSRSGVSYSIVTPMDCSLLISSIHWVPGKNTGSGPPFPLVEEWLVACLLFSVPWRVVRGTPIPLPPPHSVLEHSFALKCYTWTGGTSGLGDYELEDVTSLTGDWTGGHPVWTGPLASLLL